MAYGWTHNYIVNAAEVSAPEAGLGLTTPAQMAPMIAATRAVIEFYSTNESPKGWLTADIIAQWGVDQLATNAVSIVFGDDTVQFIRQPDGSYTPPAGNTMSLSKTNSAFALSERHGRTFKFDSTGRLTNIVDQYSAPLTITYLSSTSSLPQTVTDWKGRALSFGYAGIPPYLISVTNSGGPGVSFGYTSNAFGQLDLTSVTDPEHQAKTFVYDTNHQMVAVSNALPQLVVSNIFNSFGQVVTQYTQGDPSKMWVLYWSGYRNTEQDPAGGRRRFSFDDKHRSTALQDALGNLWQTTYDGQNHAITSISPLNETNQVVFDSKNNPIATVDSLNYSNRLIFDANNNPICWIDERGSTNYFGYNSKFQVTAVTNAEGEWTTFGYDTGNGLLTSRVDFASTNSYAYDANGYLAKITFPANLGSEGFLNNALGDVLTWTNGRAFTINFQYNQRRQLTNTTGPTNLSLSAFPDAVGNLQLSVDPRGSVTSNFWSATRKLLAITFPAIPQGTPVARSTYDNRDWFVGGTDALGKPSQLGFDLAGNNISFTDPLNRTNWFGSDADGRVLSSTNAALEVIQQQLNARGEVTNWIDPASRSVGLGIDAAGNQTGLTNRNSKRWQFGYDKANRQTTMVSPLLRTNSVSFDSRGLPSTNREPSGQTTTVSTMHAAGSPTPPTRPV
jgi:YD repeat-containing protein